MLGVCLCDCLIDDLVHVIGVHRILLGDGVADDGAALETHVPLGLHDLCHGLFILAVVVQLVAGGAAVECGQLVGAKTENRHAVGLEVLERQTEVQNALCARADDADRRVGELLQVGGDVHGLLCAAMHAADAAGCEEADAGEAGNDHGRCDGRCAGLTGGKIDSHVAAADLADVLRLAHGEQLFIVQTDLQLAADDSGRCGDSALFADNFFYLVGKFDILRIRHAVAENGGFQSNNRLACCKRFGDFRCNGQIIMQIHCLYSFSIDSRSEMLIWGLMVLS